ncbi:MAG: hypothetical protein ACYC5Y_04400 [Symbiobacteriia bacterium]
MRTKLLAVLMLGAFVLAACSQPAGVKSAGHEVAPQSEAPGVMQPTADLTAAFQEDLDRLRQKVSFPIQVPTDVPAGVQPTLWTPNDLSPMTYIRYVSEAGQEELLVANGPRGTGLEGLPGKTGKPVAVNGSLGDAHFLINQPEFGGNILWWSTRDSYVALSGPHLTEQDLIRIANSMAAAPSPAGEGSQGTTEREVLALFKGDATPDADARRIIALLPKVNWRVYDGGRGRKTVDLLEWLDTRQLDDVQEIESVLWGTGGLDGAASESYSSVVGTLFAADPAKFVQALATLTEEQAERINLFVAYYAPYQRPDIPPARAQLQDLINSPTLPGQAAQRAADLLRAIDSPPWK